MNCLEQKKILAEYKSCKIDKAVKVNLHKCSYVSENHGTGRRIDRKNDSTRRRHYMLTIKITFRARKNKNAMHSSQLDLEVEEDAWCMCDI